MAERAKSRKTKLEFNVDSDPAKLAKVAVARLASSTDQEIEGNVVLAYTKAARAVAEGQKSLLQLMAIVSDMPTKMDSETEKKQETVLQGKVDEIKSALMNSIKYSEAMSNLASKDETPMGKMLRFTGDACPVAAVMTIIPLEGVVKLTPEEEKKIEVALERVGGMEKLAVSAMSLLSSSPDVAKASEWLKRFADHVIADITADTQQAALKVAANKLLRG